MFEILVKKSLPSTNTYAKKLAGDGKNAVVVALTQTRGRGRNGKKWFSPKGGLWFSVILRPKSPNLIQAIASLAVLRSIKKLGLKPKIKWPNDVYINGRKISGVLSESSFSGKLDYVVVGIGINANFALKMLPKELRKASTTLADEGVFIGTMELLDLVLLEIKRLLKEKKSNVIREWGKNSLNEVLLNGERLSVCGLTKEGYLIVKDAENKKKIVTEGDIVPT
ncbi:MAG: biotin--[acetyl-CoA-carboxylase] ligase [Candidatus Aenigmarchaeota archaeon]|nr:biotin--[acetyl-CoA-carboxylase] ligase [Candidatus Aenigmarchaeota archaeon]